ncbi:MAG: polyvinylalcohol dehydrogenase, partial [Shimia sp.]|nr:polyvinylalcohol dehydrogenase [Shimia sp.]
MKKTLITAALVVATVSLGQAADWPNWRGPDHNGISQETDWFEKWDSSGPE